MFASSIPKEKIRTLPLLKFDGKIHLIENQDDLHKALHLLNKESILGFDTETKPTFRKGEYNHTALIQLSTMDDAYLIRINDLGIPKALITFLENSEITKVGISIRDDLKELNAIEELSLNGFIDLNDVAKDFGITQIGMRSLAGIFLESRVSKSQQTSNWEAKELSAGQLTYAATDAWVCIKIYNMLLDKGYL
jgi:ribonuclease D